jgi:hypothetical protein
MKEEEMDGKPTVFYRLDKLKGNTG